MSSSSLAEYYAIAPPKVRNEVPSDLLHSDLRSRVSKVCRTYSIFPVLTAYTEPLMVMGSGMALSALSYSTTSFTAFARSGKGWKPSRKISCYAASPKFFSSAAGASSFLRVSSLQPVCLQTMCLMNRVSWVRSSCFEMTNECRASSALPRAL